jgi:hypothetical protein
MRGYMEITNQRNQRRPRESRSVLVSSIIVIMLAAIIAVSLYIEVMDIHRRAEILVDVRGKWIHSKEEDR